MPAAALTEPPPDAHRDYSVAEAAAALGMSRRWLSGQAAARQVPHYRHGNRFLFSAAHLAEIREMSEVRPQPMLATRARRRRGRLTPERTPPPCAASSSPPAPPH